MTATISESLTVAIQQHQAGQFQSAEAAYRQILEKEPLHAEVWHLLGLLCTQTGRHDQAVECISHALGGRPDWAEAHLNLGIAWSGLGKSDEAIACYRRASN